MKKDRSLFSGILYFYVHFVTEVICFYIIGKIVGTNPSAWLTLLAYDMLAFVPQSLVGYFSDRFPKIPLAVPGLFLLGVSPLLYVAGASTPVWLVVLCMGNAFTHVNGAEATLRISGGKLAPSAVFVAGGSFGVVTGRLLASNSISWWIFVIFAATAVPFALLAQLYLDEDGNGIREIKKGEYNYHKKTVAAGAVIAVAVFVVCVRGYMGYGIPTSWKKTTIQTIALFSMMGAGKALGGFACDRFGVRSTAVFSVLAALPFLLFGDRNMWLSLIGVVFFSMTMATTLGVLVSALPKNPGLAFGLTTIGLFLGTVPIFFFKFTTVKANCILISVLSAVCLIGIFMSFGKEKRVSE